MNIPQQYLPVMPYLILNNAKAFIEFARAVFGANEQLIAPADNDKIMHGELKIHDAVIMFADAGDNWKEKTAAMYMYVDDVNNVYNKALKNSCKSLQSPEQKEYGFTAGFEDPFGNHWFIVEPKKE
jgi:uncharacterized glyoxalase superfamily protein PhnB